MHRPFLIVALALLVASMPLSAQRGGGHAAAGGHGFGGGHSGFASHSGFAGHASSGHAFAGMRTGSSSGAGSFGRGSTFHSQLSSRGFNRGFNRSGVGLRIRSRRFENNCYWYGCGWGFGYPYLGGGIDPYWWWSGSSYDQDQQDQMGLANEMNAQSLDQQRMREQGDQDAYARSAAPQVSQEVRTDPAPATLLVFRDQHKQEVQNYAIVGQTLWNFAPQRTQKIPLSDLDIPATTKANDERGVDFRLPGAHEGQ
jgi:hypothetical protein